MNIVTAVVEAVNPTRGLMKRDMAHLGFDATDPGAMSACQT